MGREFAAAVSGPSPFVMVPKALPNKLFSLLVSRMSSGKYTGKNRAHCQGYQGAPGSSFAGREGVQREEVLCLKLDSFPAYFLDAMFTSLVTSMIGISHKSLLLSVHFVVPYCSFLESSFGL